MKQYIPADQEPTPINEEVTLSKAQELVGGYVELVRIPNYNGQLLVNEDGRLMNMKPNFAATVIARQQIVGPAVLLTEDDQWT